MQKRSHGMRAFFVIFVPFVVDITVRASTGFLDLLRRRG
jgi:hypothetical protein